MVFVERSLLPKVERRELGAAFRQILFKARPLGHEPPIRKSV